MGDVNGPIRMCVACRRRAPANSLLRLAVVDGLLIESRTATGRGAWVCAPPEPCGKRAIQQLPRLARALRVELDRAAAGELLASWSDRNSVHGP